MRFRPLIKHAFGLVGLNISRVAREPRTTHHLLAQKVDLVLDVGANAGQYVRGIRSSGYAGRVVSFEPLPDAHAKLLSGAAGDPMWRVYRRCAIGAARGYAEINVAANSKSSSILPMLVRHMEASAGSGYVGTTQTEVLTLCDVLADCRDDARRTFVKVDTQGFESYVLEGGANCLASIQGIQLEMSTVPLYENQELYGELLARVLAAGYTLWSIEPGFTDTTTGQMLQFDAIFYR